jgi:hypothetical protein
VSSLVFNWVSGWLLLSQQQELLRVSFKVITVSSLLLLQLSSRGFYSAIQIVVEHKSISGLVLLKVLPSFKSGRPMTLLYDFAQQANFLDFLVPKHLKRGVDNC